MTCLEKRGKREVFRGQKGGRSGYIIRRRRGEKKSSFISQGKGDGGGE